MSGVYFGIGINKAPPMYLQVRNDRPVRFVQATEWIHFAAYVEWWYEREDAAEYLERWREQIKALAASQGWDAFLDKIVVIAIPKSKVLAES